MRLHLIAFATTLSLGACAPVPPAESEDTGTAEQHLYPKMDTLWHPRDIPVCWENPSASNATERGWVRESVEDTWQANTAINFVGWGTCQSGSKGIRIVIRDAQALTVALGDELNGVEEGMVLNFTFQNWGSGYAGHREQAIRWLAVHEFGHALGFAHEQNRPDTPSSCTQAPQGEDGDHLVGAWDLYSVMNYCSPDWDVGAVHLSVGDKTGLHAMYGIRDYMPTVWSQSFDGDSGWLPSENPRFLADVNGDGKKDVVGFGDSGVSVALSTGTSFGTATQWVAAYGINNGWTVTDHPRFLADVNGDGKDDIVGFANAGIYVSLSNGSSFGAPQLWLAAMGYNQGWRGAKHPRFLADVNGDGKADVIGISDSGVHVALSTGTGLAPLAQWINKFGYNDGWTVIDHPRFLADVNGDGKADVVGFANSGVYVSLSTGTSFGAQTQWIAKFGHNDGWLGSRHPRVLADVNGDGKADVVGFADSGAYVSLSTGTSFGAQTQWSDAYGYDDGWTVDWHPRFLADVNGDGKADVVGFGDSGLFVSRSTGTSFMAPSFRLREYGAVADGWSPLLHLRLVGDVNGDGRADVVGFAWSGVHVSLQ